MIKEGGGLLRGKYSRKKMHDLGIGGLGKLRTNRARQLKPLALCN